MTVIETNNIRALRAALERLDDLKVAIDDVTLNDTHYTTLTRLLDELEKLLENELSGVERDLIDTAAPRADEYVGRQLYAQ